MRIGLQSIVFGDETPLFTILREARNAGYAGIELFNNVSPNDAQPISNVFHQEHAAFQKEKQKLANSTSIRPYENEMTLTGVSGSSLDDRISFVEAFCKIRNIETHHPNAPYVYTDEWDERCEKGLNRRMKIMIHPHMYRPIQTIKEAKEKALNRFNQSTTLQLMPDTAHMLIAGEDPESTIVDNFDRIGCVHLKDWNPSVGRSYQFYARGFCPLGRGAVSLDPILKLLWRRGFNGWLIVEQDSAQDPIHSIRESMTFLKSKDRLPPRLFT